jgi:hypothetical protein
MINIFLSGAKIMPVEMSRTSNRSAQCSAVQACATDFLMDQEKEI